MMTDETWRLGLTLVAALGCGLVGGVFFGFSTFVMRALGRLPAADGLAAMQTLNVAAITPLFMGAFLGTGVVCALAVVSAASSWGEPGAAQRLIGGLLYLVGSFGVTMAFNVPLNNRLATTPPNVSRSCTPAR